jgi:hypothetical protein
VLTIVLTIVLTVVAAYRCRCLPLSLLTAVAAYRCRCRYTTDKKFYDMYANNTHGLSEGEMTMFGYLTEMDDAVGLIVQALHDASSFANTVFIVSVERRVECEVGRAQQVGTPVYQQRASWEALILPFLLLSPSSSPSCSSPLHPPPSYSPSSTPHLLPPPRSLVAIMARPQPVIWGWTTRTVLSLP